MTADPAADRPRLFGRRSSHFTRVAAIYAHALDVDVERVVVTDLMALDPAAYGGHPALKIPTLHIAGDLVFGAEPICRRLAACAGRAGDPRLVWPEQLGDAVARNAHELTWHAMAAQVQLVVGTGFAKLPADNPFFAKAAAGLRGALAWLDAHVDGVVAGLPPRDLSLTEVGLLCLIEHLAFRPTVPVADYPALARFGEAFGHRPAAAATRFALEAAP